MADKTDGVLAVLRKTRQFFGGADDRWEWDDGEPFDTSALDNSIGKVAELLAADEEYDEARAAIVQLEKAFPGSWFFDFKRDDANRRWKNAIKRRAAAIRAMRGEA